MTTSSCAAQSILITAFVFLTGIFSAQAQADFEADRIEGCATHTVKFTDKSVGATSWSWNFGKPSNTTSIEKNPEVIYDVPGTYTVTLTINGSITETKTAYIKVYAKPTPDFSVNYTPGCAPLPVQFTNKTIDARPIKSYLWVFGDGESSAIENPSHTYRLGGPQTVTLLVENDKGCKSTAVKANAVIAQQVEANFTASKTFTCNAPEEIQFTSSSIGPGTLSYQWDFGGAGTSTEKDPKFTFTQNGSYKISLTVNGDFGCSHNTIKTINIGSFDVPINADKEVVCEGGSVTFSLNAIQNLEPFEWDLGNGIKSTEVTPTATYTKAGTYTVALSGTMQGCTVKLTKTITVSAGPVTKFDFNQTCNKLGIFKNTSIGHESVLWNFGDGQTSTEENPKHFYAISGEYTIQLTTYNGLRCEGTVVRKIKIVDDPTAIIFPQDENSCDKESLAGCAPFTINLESKSISELSYTSHWTFGDGSSSTTQNPSHVFTKAGLYEVKLTIKNTLGCISATTVNVNVSDVKPVADFTIDRTEVCALEMVTMTSISTNADFFCWEIEPGNIRLTGEAPTYRFNKPGVYTVKLTAKNAGCVDVEEKIDVITVKDPLVEYTFDKNCADPYTVSFTNGSMNETSFDWDFGDGNSEAVARNPVHTYLDTGAYFVTLRGTSAVTGCTVAMVRQIVIQDVKADFEINNYAACKGSPVSITDKSQFAVGWIYDFGDNAQAGTPNAQKTYNTPGSYYVSLTVMDSDGCLDTKVSETPLVVIDIDGQFAFTASSTCDSLKVNFEDRTQASPPVTAWLWDFGDGKTSDQQNPPTHIYTDLDSYTIKLTLTNSDGTCSVISEDGVVFTNPEADFIAIRQNACMNEFIQFYPSVVSASHLEWDFGNRHTIVGFTPITKYDTTGAYDIILWASDTYGCKKEFTKEDYINITKPIAKFEAGNTLTDCPPLITTFNDLSTNVNSWLWKFGDGQQSDSQNPINSYLYAGRYTVSLTVTDINNCVDEISVPELVIVHGPSAHFQQLNVLNCAKDTIEFSASYNNTENARWDFGDGIVEENMDSLVLHMYNTGGRFQPLIILKDSAGCEITYKLPEMSVHNALAVDFTFTPPFPFIDESVSFTSTVGEAPSLAWFFADEIKTATTQAQKSFPQPGAQQVVLQLTDASTGCTIDVVKQVPVQGDIDLIPNVFTPSMSDDLNNVFQILGLENSSWKLVVYNRWGESVYENKNYQNNWDGGDLAVGVYYYKLQNNIRADKYYKGNVRIIR